MIAVRAGLRDFLVAPVACLAASVYIPELSLIALPICAGALGTLVFNRPLFYAVMIAVGATVLSALISPARALMVGPTLGAVIWASLDLRRADPLKIAGVLGLVTFAGFVAWLAVDQALIGSSLLEYVREETTQVMAQLEEMVERTADAETRRAIDGILGPVEMILFQIWPAVNLVLISLGAFFAVGIISRVGTRAGADVRRIPPLDRLDMSWHVVWPLIAALGLLVASVVTSMPETWWAALGRNLMVVSGALLALQGLAVAEAFLRKVKLHVVLRLIAYAALLWVGVLVPVLMVVGFADLWLNLRKLPRSGGSAPGAFTAR